MLSGLVVAIDLSEDGATIIAVVSAREHVLKRSEFLNHTSWVVHFRKLHPRRKHSYLAKLPKRFSKITRYLLYVRIFVSENEMLEFIVRLRPSVILVDDKLLDKVKEVNTLIIPEKNIRYKHHRRLMLLADNLANYFRILLKEKPKKFREEFKRFKK